MTCPEFDRLSRDVEYYRKQLKYFLFDKSAHRLPEAEAKQSANEAASALARASNLLHWHENYCSVCKRASKAYRAQQHIS
jgi:hypothetical protein